MPRHTWHFRWYSAYPENSNTNIFRLKKKEHFCEKSKNIFWPHLRLFGPSWLDDFFSKIGLCRFFILWLSTSMRAHVHTHTHTHAHKNWLPRRPIKDPYKKTNFSNCSLLQRKTGLRQKTVLLAIYFPALITTTKP